MQISVDTYCLCKSFGYRKTFSMLKAVGFDAVDFSLFGDLERTLLQDDYRKRALAIRNALDETGLVCSQTHAPFNWISWVQCPGIVYGDVFDESNPMFLETVRAMEVSAVLGAEMTVVHNLRVPDGVDAVDYNLDFYRSLIPYAEKFNIKIAIENLFYKDAAGHFHQRLGTAESMNALMEQLNSDRFVFCVDIGHALLAGIAPQTLIRSLTPGKIGCLHIQDTDTFGDRHQLPYMGEVCWDEVLKALKDVDYQGEFSFEIIKLFLSLPPELAEPMLTYAASVGNYLRDRFHNL